MSCVVYGKKADEEPQQSMSDEVRGCSVCVHIVSDREAICVCVV